MPVLIVDCPHCEAQRMSMGAIAVVARVEDNQANAAFVCSSCQGIVGAWLARTAINPQFPSVNQLATWKQDIDFTGWTPLRLWPAPQPTSAPADVPTSVARIFIQAEDAAKRTQWDAAGMAYRKALEVGLKEYNSSVTGMLAARIKSLAKSNDLTPAIAEWSNQIRILGNEATHDEVEPTQSDIEDLAAFTRVVLEYLYTMPAKVARRSQPIATQSDEQQ